MNDRKQEDCYKKLRLNEKGVSEREREKERERERERERVIDGIRMGKR